MLLTKIRKLEGDFCGFLVGEALLGRMAGGLICPGAGGAPFAAAGGDHPFLIPVDEAFRRHMLIHFTFEENRGAAFAPGPSEISLTGLTGAGEEAAAEHKAEGLGRVCVGGGVEAAALI